MIVTRLDATRPFYRFLTPRWSYLPTSGAGAAAGGGRFNRPGVEALYLSAEVETALAEYRQGSSLPPPGTLVAYRLVIDDVVDFSGGYDAAAWETSWSTWSTDWRYISRIEHEVPPSWHLADDLVQDGRCGLLFPSLRQPGGTNLVVFLANLRSTDTLLAHDPDKRLPADPSSWPR